MVAMDIVEFLTARLDEDEAAAVRAARPEPWVKPQPSRPDWYVQFWADEPDRAAVIVDFESSAYPIVATLGYDGNDEADEELAEGRVEHIARHDPARVLAEVKAKRALVKLHSPMVMHGDGPGAAWYDMTTVCRTCEPPRQFPKTAWPCLTARLLAAVYADHPDYDPAWRVQ